ncbi:cyclase family protein [Alteribacillus iranensis]|uniref:Kynurenine formamidase n=1 Tax=Alteribacillus iranensis TaxID=930128 RepID=A0A1I2E4W4_9BACI|nr:cyclase family protein [Alteribacillus iranensis]SFE87875.1 Kynurenine formamidase [Alteribacillus iranensis]
MNYSKVIDLSIPVTNDTPVFPGDPKPTIYSAASITDDGYNVSKLEIGSHTGTHVDSPYHIMENGHRMDETPLEQCMGKGFIINATEKKPGTGVTLNEVKDDIEKAGPGKIALFYTGWSHYLGTEKYFNHPYITEEVVTALLDKGVRTFFIDALNIDPPTGNSFACHEAITAKNGIIGENFTNFDQLDVKDPFIIALPLKLAGLDGSPVRAVALIEPLTQSQ